MSNRRLLLQAALPAALLALPLALGARAQEASAAATSPLAHERYTLPNGMDVILAPDRSAPQAVVDIWYHVGSKDEPRDRTGFAHLFEHLMFMGTERATDFDVIMEGGGGWNNASTSPDRTNYFDVAPSDMLPTLLWLEADRLERLALDMDQVKLEAQRGVVLNEYRQNYENRPYAKAELALSRLLFPPTHPYHIDTIGLPEHIEAATLEDVILFFKTFYVPNNASLVVAGDFDPEALKPLIAELFGTLPRRDDPPRQEIPALTLDQTVRRSLVDEVRLPQITFGWHSPAFYQAGDAELDLLAGLLGDAPNGRLYKRLVVDDGLAADVTVMQVSQYLGSMFVIQVLALPDADLSRIEAAVDQELREVMAGAIGEEELTPFKAAYELRLLRPVDSLRDRADLLNQYAFYFGEPDSLEQDLARYRGIDANRLRSYANGVFGAPGRAIVTVLPAPEPLEVNPRDQRPADLPAGELALDVEPLTLANGLEVRYFERPNAPYTSLRAYYPFGSGADPKGQAGAVELLFDLLDEGATLPDGTQLDAAAFAEVLRRLGANLSVRVSDDSTVVALDVLTQHAQQAFELLESALQRPTLSETDYERLKKQALEGLRSESDDPAQVAQRVVRAAWFGAQHPFGHPPAGSVQGLEALSLKELVLLHQRLVLGTAPILFSAAPWTTALAQTAFESAFGGLPAAGGAKAPSVPARQGLGQRSGLEIAFCDAPGATQTQVHFLGEAPGPASAERLDLELITTVLGGTFSSRLNANLREKQHWTYGARARYAPWRSGAYIEATARIQVDKTGPAIDEFLKEFEGLAAANLTGFEDQKARNSMTQRVVQAAASTGGLCDVAVTQERLGLSLSSLNQMLEEAKSSHLAAMNDLAPKAFNPKLLVLVGDKAAVWPQLEALAKAKRIDLSRLIEVGPDGQPLGSIPATRILPAPGANGF